MKLTWLGHAAFAMEADGKQILVDPFLTGNPAASSSPDDFSPSVILLTHAHGDHMGDTVAIAKRGGALVVAIAEIATWLGKQGVENVAPVNFGGTYRFDGGSAKMVPAWHTSSYGDDFDAPSVPAGYVVRFGGQTIYFAGDTCLFGDMALIGEEGLDIAVLPIGDNYTMGPDDALKAVKLLKAPTVVPCHYDTFPLIAQDAGAFAAKVGERTDSVAKVLKPGESFEAA